MGFLSTRDTEDDSIEYQILVEAALMQPHSDIHKAILIAFFTSFD